jgi:GNAT superfamily N-acetyltransferase
MAASIRPMRIEDAVAVANLAGQLGYPSTPIQIEHRFRGLEKLPDSQVLVADSAGAIVGWLHVFAGHALESEGHAEVGGLVVDAGARGRGIGKALLEAAEAWARSRGYAEMRIRSNTIRTDTHEFYLRRGYSIAKTQLNFKKPLR